MDETKHSAEDVAILERLNFDYNQADQASDAKRFSELLAADFTVQTPQVHRDLFSGFRRNTGPARRYPHRQPRDAH